MNELIEARNRTQSVVERTRTKALALKAAGIDLTPMPGLAQFSQFRQEAANRERYELNRGWVHAAINALASEAAGQSVTVARMKGRKDKTRKPGGPKHVTDRMPREMRRKAAQTELEVLEDHPLLDALDQPNPIQGLWQFVYSFVFNLNLTGWSYVVMDSDKEGRPQWYSLPTTWIKPVHKKGPFAQFKVVDPSNPAAHTDDELLDRSQVGFAHIPNPANPMAAQPPAGTQIQAIRIDDHIQASQEVFFENGVFPSVIITMGRDPLLQGDRPVLTAHQRRQIETVIRKSMQGVANYGAPAIIDGLVESIDRLSASQNEMGWEKSEDKVATRILSAFGVHRFILGDTVSIGGYAQARIIYERFFKRVNTFLSMLSRLMTNLSGGGDDDKLLIWWEECEASDPTEERAWWNAARANGDVNRNEFRAHMGLPPDETGGEYSRAWSAGDVNAWIAVQGQVAAGAIEPAQAAAFYTMAFDIPADDAKKLAGKAPPPKEPPPAPGTPPPAPGAEGGGSTPPAKKPPETDEEALAAANENLEKAMLILGLGGREIAEAVAEVVG